MFKLFKLFIMSMMFSAVAGAGCPNPCGDTQTENCLRSDGHLEITDAFAGVTRVPGTSGALVVGAGAFHACTTLTSVSMPEVQRIGNYAFALTSLTSVYMPKVTEIGASAFKDTSLTSVTMPLVTTIGFYAFDGCTLTSVTMNAITTIGSQAFSSCSLTSVTMPKVTTIQTFAFKDTGLTWVYMPKVTSIGTDAFGGTPYSTKNPWQDKTVLKVQYSSLGC